MFQLKYKSQYLPQPAPYKQRKIKIYVLKCKEL